MAAMLSSCKPRSLQKQLKNVATERLPLRGEEKQDSKIAFFTFRVSLKDSATNAYEVKWLSAKFAEGRIKKPSFVQQTIVKPNYLYYQILGEKGAGGNGHFEQVQDPLSTAYESPGDDGGLTKTVVRKKSGELVIRFQYDETTKSILIFKPDPASLNLKPIYHATF
jgi:hypothetical protein